MLDKCAIGTHRMRRRTATLAANFLISAAPVISFRLSEAIEDECRVRLPQAFEGNKAGSSR